MGPLLSMRKALYAALSQDAALQTLLGGKKIFASVPPATEPPYVSFGVTRLSLWTGGSRIGHKHQIALDLWSQQPSDVELFALAERIAVCLETPLQPEGFAVLQCTVEAMTCQIPQADGFRQATLDVCLITEPLHPPDQ